jgi:hypothetical protein
MAIGQNAKENSSSLMLCFAVSLMAFIFMYRKNPSKASFESKSQTLKCKDITHLKLDDFECKLSKVTRLSGLKWG